MIRLICIFSFIFINPLQAEETRRLAQSPTALFMGGAYTAIAEDEYTLFYNPAVMARHKDFSFTPLNLFIDGTNILNEPDRFTDIGDTPNDFAEVAFGYPIHIGLGYTPGVKVGGFGISSIVNYQTNLNLQNEAVPMFDIDHRYDRGFIMGYGRNFGSNNAFSWGVSTKYIQRESINGSYNLTGTSLLGALSSGELDTILEDLGQVKGSGWGFDIGFDYVKQSGDSQILMGLALMDVYTVLHTQSNDQDLEVHTQPYRAVFGSAYKLKLITGLDVTFSMDIDHLEKQMEFMRRLRFGTEIGLTPVLSLLGGLNALDNYSWGVKANAGLFKLYAGFYTEEIGEKLSHVESDRFLIYLSMFDFTFSP